MPRKPRQPGEGDPEIVDVLVDEPVIETPTVEPEPRARPAPESALTAEQRRIRDLENQLAVERGGKDPEVEYDVAGAGETILIHFLEDGFTALGHVWYRGQELEFEPGSAAYRDTKDRLGRSWLDLRHNEFAQVERYGKVVFRVGPWPGKTYADAATVPFESLKAINGGSVAPTEAEFQAAQRAEDKRRRAAPRLPVR